VQLRRVQELHEIKAEKALDEVCMDVSLNRLLAQRSLVVT
jgi:hypothetical protein